MMEKEIQEQNNRTEQDIITLDYAKWSFQQRQLRRSDDAETETGRYSLLPDTKSREHQNSRLFCFLFNKKYVCFFCYSYVSGKNQM